MLQAGVGIGQGKIGLVQPGENVGLPEGFHPADRLLELVAVDELLQPDAPVGALIEAHHAQKVQPPQHAGGLEDGGLGDLDLRQPALHPVVAARHRVRVLAVAASHAARLVDRQHQRQVRLLLLVTHVHKDRQGIFQRGAQVPAGAVAVGAAHHHQPAPQLPHVLGQRPHGGHGQLRSRHVDDEHGIVAAQRGEIARRGCRRDDFGFHAGRHQRRPQRLRLPGQLGQQQNTRRALDEGECRAPVVLGQVVGGRGQLDPIAAETGFVGHDRETHAVRAAHQLDLEGSLEAPAVQQHDGGALRDAALDHRLQLESLPLAHRRRRVQRVHVRLDAARSLEPDEAYVDIPRGRHRGKRRRLTFVLQPVGKQDGSLAPAFGQQRQRKLQRALEVAARRYRDGGDARQLLLLSRQPLHQGVTAKHDDRRPVPRRHGGQAVADEGLGPLPLGRRNGIGAVEEKDCSQRSGGAHDLRSCQRQDQQQQDGGADCGSGPQAPRERPEGLPAIRGRHDPRQHREQRQRQHQQRPQRQRVGEGDTHRPTAAPERSARPGRAAAAANRNDAPPATRAAARRAPGRRAGATTPGVPRGSRRQRHAGGR